ncbi:GGDEF domain-containing protein [Aquisediminimonas profunda]|uniref:GGDEF domain-containing protein n=1 Tax=Aquisediminimonas profunda TaxID=1550733 RepID=UPI001C625F01|nr:GGDEF domain-containing protein [Aquisediminimonas profunda]
MIEEKQAAPGGNTVTKVVERLFGRSNSTVPSQPTGELARYNETIQTVREVMLRHVIEPNPANYDLVYRHVIAHEPRLEEAMERLIRSGYASGTLSFSSAQGGVSESAIDNIVEDAQKHLVAIEAMIKKSTTDAKGFGDALEGSAAKFSNNDPDSSLQSLISVTKAMIEKTRAAENELRLRSKAMTDLKMSLNEAQVQADTDALTGLSNRRAFERMLGAGGARAMMSGKPMSLAICDIDHFKKFNDTYGHDVGDRVLRFVSSVLLENCGRRGAVSRHGGEEFVVIFEETTPEMAYEIIDAARRDLCERNFVNKDTDESIGNISFSAGVAVLGGTGDVGHLLRSADRSLYKAKADGRNCVVMAPQG